MSNKPPGLTIPPGRLAEPLVMEVRRELKPEDLLRLGEAPKVGLSLIKRLKATHHRQAMLIAQGIPLSEIAIRVGCTTRRLAQLQDDPSFAELIALYQDQMAVSTIEDARRVQEKLVDVGEMAIDELKERLEDDAKLKALPIGEVRKIAEFAMDRTVAPPKAAPNTQAPPAAITINFGTALKDRSSEVKTIEGKVENGK